MAEMGTLDILVRALGAKETEDELKDLSDEQKKAAKTAEKQSKLMEKFATRFAGTMAIVLGSLSAAAGALLLKAPIISEIGFALGVLVEELAFMMDTVLAPALEPLLEAIFALTDTFDGLPTPIKKVITAGVLLALVIGAAGAAIAGLVIAGAVAAVVILAVAMVLGTLALAIASNIALVLLLKKAWDSNFLGIQTTTEAVVGTIQGLISGFMAFIEKNFGEDIRAILSEIGVLFGDLAATIKFWMDLNLTVIKAILGLIKKAWDSDLGGIKTSITTAFEFIEAVIFPIIKMIGTILLASIKVGIDAIQLILALLRGDWKRAWEEAKSIVTTIVNAIVSVIENIADAFKGVINVNIGAMNKIIEGLNNMSFSIPEWVPGFGGKSWSLDIDKLPKLDVGGKVEGTGAATVHKGETVLTKQLTEMLEQFFSSGGSGGGSIVINIDGQKIAEVVNDYNTNQASGMGW